jgi:hypothetical protein
VADASFSRQTFRKVALVFAYALVASFGAAVMLIMEDRPLDEREHVIIGIVGAGAFLGATLVMLYARRLMRLSPLPRFGAVFFAVMLITFLIQGALAGGFFNLTAFSEPGSLATFDGLLELSFTSVYGFAYYLIYGLSLAWPVGLAAGFLFSLGFLTLRPQNDTKEAIRRQK